MAASDIKDLERHIKHRVVCVSYAGGANVAVECETCREVLVDFDNGADRQEDYQHLSGHIGHALEVVMKHDRTVIECGMCDDELLAFSIEEEASGTENEMLVKT